MHPGELLQSAGGATRSVTLAGSPHSHVAASNGAVFISGGTVSLVEYGRSGSFVGCGVVAGGIPVSRGDTVRITYTVAPTVNFVPAAR